MIIKRADGTIAELSEKTINVAALEAEKKQIESSLSSFPKYKEKPDEETLDLWNRLVMQGELQAETLQRRLNIISGQQAAFKTATEVTVTPKAAG